MCSKLSFDLMRSPDSSERPVAAASTPNFPAAHANSAANVISVVLAAASNAICNESIPGAITPRYDHFDLAGLVPTKTSKWLQPHRGDGLRDGDISHIFTSARWNQTAAGTAETSLEN
jgi:hypothetical protein